MERGTCQCECETFVGPRETDPDQDDPARSTLSIQNSISGEGDRYAYKPLPTPHAFRIMYLLPGSFEDPIQIKLHVCPITSVSRCATLSYEWGTSPLRRNIVCDGKMLEVTTNLYTALKRLRQTDRVGFWWIDAICINQIDNQEKNQQVPLMGEIYKSSLATFAWIGEEPEGIVKESHEIPSGEKLKELAQSTSWSGIVDVLLRRSYFTRLWVLQEIALASQVTVVCGR
ncbi:heterokaryon incompatibility protein-domain-containing protein, partial [Leptodontidium sp. 2 PMI_412]